MADVAAHVHLGGRLREGEEGRSHADLGLGTEHLAGEQEDGLLEVGEGHVLVDVETLHLVEDAVRAGADGFVAEHAARADHADGRLHPLHGAHLHAGGVGAEQQRVGMARGHEEGVLHVARRVVRREVERLEDVVVVLELGAFRDVVAEFAEDVHDFLADDGHRMAGAQLQRVAGHREVLLGALGGGLLADGVAQAVDRLLREVLQLVERAAELALHVLVHGAELLEERRDLTLLAEETHARLLHFLLGFALEVLQFCKDPVDIFSLHTICVWRRACRVPSCPGRPRP